MSPPAGEPGPRLSAVVVSFNTRDGITTNDVATVQGGSDAHVNWAFTQPGDYAVTVEVSGTLVITRPEPAAKYGSTEPSVRRRASAGEMP